MGAIRNLGQNIDPAAANSGIQRELVENLARLAESKAEFLGLQAITSLTTAGGPNNLTIPVESVLDSVTYTHAYSNSDVDKISGSVRNALRSFCSGTKDQIISSVGSLISDSLQTFLGNTSANEKTMQRYYVMTEGYSIIRIDVLAWQLTIEAAELKKLAQKVSAFAVVKSAVDLVKIRPNTLLSVYSNQLATTDLERAALRDALVEAREIYQTFTSDVRTTLPQASF